MPKMSYFLSFNAERHDPPVTQSELNERHGVGQSFRMGCDAAILLALHFDEQSLVKLDTVPLDGRESGRKGAFCPGALPSNVMFRALLLFSESLLELRDLNDEARGLCEAIRDYWRDREATAIRAHEMANAPQRPIVGCPSWVVEQGGGFGVAVEAAWSEVLGFTLDERIEGLPLGVKLEWQAYLAGFTRALGEHIKKARPGVGKPLPVAAADVVRFVRARIKREIDNRTHPALEVPNATR